MVRKILVLAANPINTSRLRLDKEVEKIEEALNKSSQGQNFELKQKWAVKTDSLREALLKEKPEFVHFCGHGDGENGLVFEAENDQAKLVSTSALSTLFELCKNDVKCVILNACYSEVQAQAISEHIDYVIGMNQAIGDEAAIQFAIGFYDAIGAGRSIEDAYRFGCNAIELEGSREHLTPLLFSADALWERMFKQATFTNRIKPVLQHLGLARKEEFVISVGDKIRVEIQLEVKNKGYLLLLDRDSSGEILCICPSRYAPETTFEDGKMNLPQDINSSFTIYGPTGTEHLIAIFSPKPFEFQWLSETKETVLTLNKAHLNELVNYLNTNSEYKVFRTEYVINS